MTRWRGRAGRTFSRRSRRKPRAGRTFSRVWVRRCRIRWHVYGLVAACKPRRHPRWESWVPKEAAKAGEEGVAHASLRGPSGTPYAAKKFARPLMWTRSPAQPHTATRSACRSARGRGPGRSQQHMRSDNYRNNFTAFGPIMNGARIIDEPRPTPKPPITSVTQWTPRYRRVTQINTMNVSAAAHSR